MWCPFRIGSCCIGFQVLRHPWIVDKAQLSDRALTRQNPDTVKVINTVICHASPLVSAVYYLFRQVHVSADNGVILLFHQGALSATYCALRRCAPAPVLEPVQSSSLAQRRGMKKLGSPKLHPDHKEKE